MLGLKLIHVSKRGPSASALELYLICTKPSKLFASSDWCKKNATDHNDVSFAPIRLNGMLPVRTDWCKRDTIVIICVSFAPICTNGKCDSAAYQWPPTHQANWGTHSSATRLAINSLWSRKPSTAAETSRTMCEVANLLFTSVVNWGVFC